MTKRTLSEAVQALADTLQKTESLKASIAAELQELNARRERIEKFCMETTDERLAEVPEIVAKLSPFVAFTATPKTIGSCIDAAIQTKNVLIPGLEAATKSEVGVLKEQLEMLEGYALQELERAGTSSQKGLNDHRVESRIQVRYAIADKTLFLSEMEKLGALSEVTVSIPQNSKAMAKIIEDLGDVPPGVTQSRRKIACFVKG